ncbi:hypothetical protein M569_11775, partial [Genlisea aurea]
MIISEVMEILGRPTILAILIWMMEFLLPLWIAFLVGLLAGWVWRPRSFNCGFRISVPCLSYGLVNHRSKGSDSAQSLDSDEALAAAAERLDASETEKEIGSLLTDDDFEHLHHLVESFGQSPPWKRVMDRSTSNMSYQAWQRDIPNGPPQYCSRTVYEDATPELLRDFFWDDEFRLKWDDMIVQADILEESAITGAMVVHWIRKFPFFCSDREYIIGRRIWESKGSYYCVTKGVPYESVPRKDKPRRVDVYYSSWLIRTVRNGPSSSSTSEVLLFHHEDMGIPWEIAKIGVRQGMWGAVKNIERGFRAYQKYRFSGGSVSHHATMAHINTKVHVKEEESSSESQIIIMRSSSSSSSSGGGGGGGDDNGGSKNGIHIPKMLIVGGVVALACSLDQGLLTKTLIFGIARKLGSIGRRAMPR